MSGTSLDGLDIAYCEFYTLPGGRLDFRLLAAETIPYSQEWVDTLSHLEQASAYDYALANVRLGHYFGQQVNAFRSRHDGRVDLVASHGHTIFHQPQLGLTSQIGDGDAIAAETGLPVAFNFRTFDVALGGQGAPLVPVGDQLLFSQYEACLNLGGFSNISFAHADGRRVAFDISPCNMALNTLARREGLAFDRDGLLARRGKVLDGLLRSLDALPYYSLPSPKSLGKEWFVAEFLPLLTVTESVPDLLATTTMHIARQIASVLNANSIRSMVVTGGGALNKYLIELLGGLAPDCRITVPSADIINYKEAIIFALLGYLRVNNQPNALASVTGARRDSSSGNLSGM